MTTPLTGDTVTVDTLTEFYINAVIEGNNSAKDTALLVYAKLLTQSGTNHPEPEVFEGLVLPLLNRSEALLSLDPEVSAPILFGLFHPDCPASVLHATVRTSRRFRHYAAEHPNCPDEDKIYVFLLGEGTNNDER